MNPFLDRMTPIGTPCIRNDRALTLTLTQSLRIQGQAQKKHVLSRRHPTLSQINTKPDPTGATIECTYVSRLPDQVIQVCGQANALMLQRGDRCLRTSHEHPWAQDMGASTLGQGTSSGQLRFADIQHDQNGGEGRLVFHLQPRATKQRWGFVRNICQTVERQGNIADTAKQWCNTSVTSKNCTLRPSQKSLSADC